MRVGAFEIIDPLPELREPLRADGERKDGRVLFDDVAVRRDRKRASLKSG